MDATKLIDYLNEHEPLGFEAGPCYVPESDTLIVFTSETESYAKRIDEYLTIYLAIGTDEPVGFEIKGLRRHVENARKLNVGGSAGSIHWVVKALAFHGVGRSVVEVPYFEQIGRAADSAIGPEADELLAVC
jgi:hypothetical protein